MPWRRNRLPSPVLLGFPCDSAGKESTCNAGDLGWIPGLGRSPGEGKGYPLQYSGLENSMDCIDYGVAESWTRLSGFHFHFSYLMYNVVPSCCAAKRVSYTHICILFLKKIFFPIIVYHRILNISFQKQRNN